jgi:hypothetical protein
MIGGEVDPGSVLAIRSFVHTGPFR